MNKSLWLAKLLNAHPEGLDKRQILDAWRKEDERGKPMAQSTFYDNLRYLTDRYGIDVTSCKGIYRISSAGAPAMLQQLLQPVSAPSPEEAANASTSRQWLPVLADAIGRRTLIRMTYRPYDKPQYDTDFAPYCLRMASGRYYCVGLSSHHKEVRTFAIDRMRVLIPTATHFVQRKDFNVDAYFRHSIGAFGGMHLRPEHITLEADERIAAYLRGRPLHPSQKELRPGVFCIDVAVTHDLVGQILFYGPHLHVTAPESLRKHLREQLLRALKFYE